MPFDQVVRDVHDHFVDVAGRNPTISEIQDDIIDNYPGYEDIDADPALSRKWYVAIMRELNQQGLEYQVNEALDSGIVLESSKSSRYLVDFDFTYPGEQESESYSFWIPERLVIEAVRRWFSDREVEIDGTDNHIWNICGDLAEVFGKDDSRWNNLMDAAIEDQEDWIKEQCKDEAWEEFVDE